MKVKLSDVCERGSSNLKQSDVIDKNGDYPIYGASGYIGNVDFFHQEKKYIAIVKDGAGIGRTMLLPAKSSVIGTMQYLLPKDNVLTEYLYYVVKYMRLEKYFTGATIPHIYFKDYKNEEFNCVSIEKQIEIVESLKKVERIISNRKQQLAKLDELIKARFVELFGDFRINDKGFVAKKGNELFKFSSGKFLPEGKRRESGIPVYGGNGIAWYTNEHLVDYPTVIIGRVGAQCGNVHSVTKPVWITDNAIYIKEQKTTAYTLEFLTELMRMMNFYQYADFSGQPKITQKPLETLLYIMPPIELQKEYTTFVEQVDKSKVAVQKALDKAQTLFDSLMQQYFG